MATIENQKQWKCRSCANTFNTRGRKDAYYKREHQTETSASSRNYKKRSTERTEQGKFVCACEKNFWRAYSLKRYQQGCYAAIAMIEGGGNSSVYEEGIVPYSEG